MDMSHTITKKERSYSFTEGKIVGPLIRFALPLLAAQILQTAYGAVDLEEKKKRTDASR